MKCTRWNVFIWIPKNSIVTLLLKNLNCDTFRMWKKTIRCSTSGVWSCPNCSLGKCEKRRPRPGRFDVNGVPRAGSCYPKCRAFRGSGGRLQLQIHCERHPRRQWARPHSLFCVLHGVVGRRCSRTPSGAAGLRRPCLRQTTPPMFTPPMALICLAQWDFRAGLPCEQ